MEIQHQLVVYTLNEDGTVPTFVNTSVNSISGFCPVKTEFDSPQDWALIGFTKYHLPLNVPPNILLIFSTKEELTEYIDTRKDELDPFMGPEDDENKFINLIDYIWNSYLEINELS